MNNKEKELRHPEESERLINNINGISMKELKSNGYVWSITYKLVMIMVIFVIFSGVYVLPLFKGEADVDSLIDFSRIICFIGAVLGMIKVTMIVKYEEPSADTPDWMKVSKE